MAIAASRLILVPQGPLSLPCEKYTFILYPVYLGQTLSLSQPYEFRHARPDQVLNTWGWQLKQQSLTLRCGSEACHTANVHAQQLRYQVRLDNRHQPG